MPSPSGDALAAIERFRRMAFLPDGTTPEAVADHFDTVLRSQPCAAAEARAARLEKVLRRMVDRSGRCAEVIRACANYTEGYDEASDMWNLAIQVEHDAQESAALLKEHT